jgi:ADP-ribose pyrophosphatase
MKLIGFQKVKDGKYLKNYELTYTNRAGKEKKYEIVSMKELQDAGDLGKHPTGVSIIAICDEKMLLLHEFRMGINRTVYNLCAGMIEPGETIEQCIARELYEETGLRVKKIHAVLPPSYAALAITDTTTQLAFVEVEGNFAEHYSENEQIEAKFYTREEVAKLVATEPFSARAQLAAYLFANGTQLCAKP